MTDYTESACDACPRKCRGGAYVTRVDGEGALIPYRVRVDGAREIQDAGYSVWYPKVSLRPVT